MSNDDGWSVRSGIPEVQSKFYRTNSWSEKQRDWNFQDYL